MWLGGVELLTRGERAAWDTAGICTEVRRNALQRNILGIPVEGSGALRILYSYDAYDVWSRACILIGLNRTRGKRESKALRVYACSYKVEKNDDKIRAALYLEEKSKS